MNSIKPASMSRSVEPRLRILDRSAFPGGFLQTGSVLPRLTLWLSLLALIVFVAWAYQAEIEQTTRAQGSVIASSRTQVIQSLEGGIVAALSVREGDTVERDQLLARLDSKRVEASFLESQARTISLEAGIARLRAEVAGRPLVLPLTLARQHPDIVAAQTALYTKRRKALAEELATLESSMGFVRRELALYEPLLKTGDVSEVDVLRLRRQLADLEAQLSNRRNKYEQDAQTELARAEDELATSRQIMAQRRDPLDHIDLRAPVRGIVKNVRVTTVGGVLRAGEELMQIVPLDDDLMIEAKVKPADVAFLKPGLDAVIKLDAYDYTIHGGLPGKLTYISADTFAEESRFTEGTYYRVHIRASAKQLPNGPRITPEIIPGMTATVEIQTGKNTVLNYLLKPILKARYEAMRER